MRNQTMHASATSSNLWSSVWRLDSENFHSAFGLWALKYRIRTMTIRTKDCFFLLLHFTKSCFDGIFQWRFYDRTYALRHVFLSHNLLPFSHAAVQKFSKLSSPSSSSAKHGSLNFVQAPLTNSLDIFLEFRRNAWTRCFWPFKSTETVNSAFFAITSRDVGPII